MLIFCISTFKTAPKVRLKLLELFQLVTDVADNGDKGTIFF